MKLTPGSGFRGGQGIWWRDMISLYDETGSGKSAVDVFAFAIDRGIDLVRDAIVALVPLEADVVGRGYAPQRTAIHFIG